MDLYSITGDPLYLDAMLGAWGLLRDHWTHVGGSIAINEGYYYPPGSYFLDYTVQSHNSLPSWASHHPEAWHTEAPCKGPASASTESIALAAASNHAETKHDKHSHSHSSMFPGGPLPSIQSLDAFEGHPTGELCGSSFWIIFNQQLHSVFPENETFAGEIERSIINVGIANPDRNGQGVRYFALLHKNKQDPTNHGTCCEGQGTRLMGSVPEHLVSYSAQGPFWDLYFASNASWDLGTHGGPGPAGHVLRVNVTSNYPYDGQVAMHVWVEAPAVEFADASR